MCTHPNWYHSSSFSFSPPCSDFTALLSLSLWSRDQQPSRVEQKQDDNSEPVSCVWSKPTGLSLQPVPQWESCYLRWEWGSRDESRCQNRSVMLQTPKKLDLTILRIGWFHNWDAGKNSARQDCNPTYSGLQCPHAALISQHSWTRWRKEEERNRFYAFVSNKQKRFSLQQVHRCTMAHLNNTKQLSLERRCEEWSLISNGNDKTGGGGIYDLASLWGAVMSYIFIYSLCCQPVHRTRQILQMFTHVFSDIVQSLRQGE